MVENKLDRKIAVKEFEYGNHTLRITVRMKHSFHDPANANGYGERYHRYVEVTALRDSEADVQNRTIVSLEEENHLDLIDYLAIWVGDATKAGRMAKKEPAVPPLEDQIEQAVRPVFEELDELYEYTMADYEIDVEVGVGKVNHEMSWVEVEDEIDRITAELDEVASR